MINKDYILRLAELFGRELSIILRLRKRDKHEDALIAIDQLLFRESGLTSPFINSLSEELLVQALSPLGKLNAERGLWIAMLLKAEGEVYEEMGNTNESYYRYVKSLYLLLEVYKQVHLAENTEFYYAIQQLIQTLNEYTISANLQLQLFHYYEQIGMYAKAENTLFELLEDSPNQQYIHKGQEFYQRLLQKTDTDLQAGDLTREEIHEGLKQIQKK